MAMTVADLKTRLAGITPGQPFTLADTDLGITAVQTLFDNYLPDKTLTVTGPVADTVNLVVTGQLALPPNYPALSVTVTFPNDGTNVTGIFIRAAMPAWEIQTSFLQLSPTYLQAFGFKVLYLVLSAQPDDTGTAVAAYGVGADFTFTAGGTTQTLSLDALVDEDPNADYLLVGEFTGVTLTDLNALTEFASGGNFDIIPQDVVPFASELELTALRVVISRGLDKVLLASIDVELADSWKIIPGKFEFDAVGATFTVLTPSNPVISALLFTDFTAFTIPFEAQISIPDLNLEAALMQPVQFSQVVAQYLPNTDLPELLIDYLRFQFNLRDQGYSIQCATTENWTIVDPIAITGLFFNISGQGTTTPNGTVGATFNIGGVDILVSATYGGSGAGWQFLGETIGDSTIDAGQLVADVLSKFKISLPNAITQIKLSDVAVSFSTAGPDFSFTCTGLFPVANENVSITVSISLNYDQKAKVFDKNVIGTIVISPQDDPAKKYNFKVIFEEDPQATTLTLQYTGTDPLNMQDIVSGLGLPDFSPPPGLDLSLTAASFTYDFTKSQLVLTTQSVNYGSAAFVSTKINNASEYFFGLGVKQTLNLSNLPLIKDVLSSDETVAISQIEFAISSNPIAANDPSIANINALINQAGAGYPNIPANGIGSGVGLSMTFSAGSWQTPLSISTANTQNDALRIGDGGAGTALATNGGDPPPPPQSSDGTTWFNLQKTYGPVTFQKVGIKYQDSVLYLLMNASLSAGGLTIAVMGLGAGSPLTTFDLHFTIDGIAITFQEGPVEISGALVGTLDPLNFYGELVLGMPEFQISALGGYAEPDGHPSFFLYAVLDYPIGGPSFFFVTGLAAGFGFNRALVIPDVSGVSTFPLVQWATGSGNPPPMTPGGNVGLQVSQVLTTLQTSGVVAPSIGEYWLALGIMFTSFEIVNSFALLTVTFGTRFEIDILGLSTLSIPPDDPAPVAQIQIELKASFSPEVGLLSIAGQLTPQSYLLSQACHLTGGFAFYLWFSGDHAGDVVLTLGGYNPNFTVPDYYPVVPRIGINWQVIPELSVTGELYFALTSNAVMAGGMMSAVWNSGPIKAWFTVWADFLMVFKPFHYYISAGIDLGASFSIKLLFVRITITIHIGVSLELWGPEFSGRATVDLSIISFTVSFIKNDANADTSIPWSDFVTQLLPSQPAAQNSLRPSAMAATSLAADDSGTEPAGVKINITQGMIKVLDNSVTLPWYLVSGETFRCSVTSVIPSKEPVDPTVNFTGNVQFAPSDQQPVDEHGQEITPNANFGAGPAGIQPADFQPNLAINLTTDEDSICYAVRLLNNAAKALWENKTFDPNTGVPQADPGTALTQTTLTNTLQGYAIVPEVPAPDHTLPIPLPTLEFTLDAVDTFDWSDPTVPTSDNFTTQTVASTITNLAVAGVRSQLLTAMGQQGIAINTSVNVGSLANPANNDLMAAPDLSLLGEQKAA